MCGTPARRRGRTHCGRAIHRRRSPRRSCRSWCTRASPSPSAPSGARCPPAARVRRRRGSYRGRSDGPGGRPDRRPGSTRDRRARAIQTPRARRRRDRRSTEGAPRTGRASLPCPWVRRTRTSCPQPAKASAGDPLGALKRVSLRDDAPALALRGIAMAQLGDLVRAKALLRSAARAFSPREAVARARCLVAEAEIALASRDLSWPVKSLEAARATLEAHGDRLNAAHARYLEVRRLLLISRLEEAEHRLAQLNPTNLPPVLKTVHELVAAGIALRRLQTKAARDALARAGLAASQADIPP